MICLALVIFLCVCVFLFIYGFASESLKRNFKSMNSII